MADLTHSQKGYFEILETLDSQKVLERTIEDAKSDLRHSDPLVRGASRVKGFTPNPDE